MNHYQISTLKLKKSSIISLALTSLIFLVGLTFFGVNKAEAAPICLNDAGRRASARVITNEYPRDNIAVNSSGCGGVTGSTEQVLISSYYGTPSGGPGSTLQTPNATFKIITIGAPTSGISVQVYKGSSTNQRCNYTSNDDVTVFVNAVAIGTLDATSSVSHIIPAGEFVQDLSLGTDVWVWQQQMIVRANNATAVHCHVHMRTLTPSSFVTLDHDPVPQNVYSEPFQKYNQNNAGQGAGPKRNLGPAGNGAVALYADLDPSYTLEYAIPFKMRCDQNSAMDISLRYYDPDSYLASDPAGVGQPIGSMGLAVYEEGTGTLVADWTLTEYNDEYGEKRLNIQPNTTYTMVYYNVTAVNGIQFWPPFSEVTAGHPSCGTTSNQPTGYIDSCEIIGGNTIFYGWAYDGDSSASTEPQVSISINGTTNQSSGTINSNIDYRTGDIEAALGIGSGKRHYGFRWDAGKLNDTGNWSVSGTVFNVGGGNDQGLGVNPSAGAPSNGFGYGFPGNAVPGSCKTAATPVLTCVIAGAPTYTMDISQSYTPTVTVTHTGPAGAPNISPMYVDFYVDGNKIGDAGTQSLANGVNYPYNAYSGGNLVSYTGSRGTHVVRVNVTGSSGVNIECTSELKITQDIAACSTSTITTDTTVVAPNKRYIQTITIRNDGDYTWDSANWGLETETGKTNNFLTGSLPLGSYVVAPWPGGVATVAPGATITFTYVHLNNMSVSTHQSYWQMHRGGVNFGPECGLGITVVQGHLADAYDWTVSRTASIETCPQNQTAITGGLVRTATTGASRGDFIFAVRQGDAFCVRAENPSITPDDFLLQSGAPDSPGSGYRSCATGHGSGPFTCFANKATAGSFYEFQAAGITDANGYDRSVDTGYDIGFAWKPIVTCTLVKGLDGEAGVTFEPIINVRNSSGAGTSPTIDVTTVYIINGIATSERLGTGTILTTQDLDITMSAVTRPPPGNYGQTARVVWSGGGYSSTIGSPYICKGDVNTCDPATDPTCTTCSINDPNCCLTSCGSTYYMPYVKYYGADVIAGGSFRPDCTTASGGIYGFANEDGVNTRGASGQFGVSALLEIKEFYSSSTKTSGNTLPIKGSTFANNIAGHTYGGALGGAGVCLPDYYTGAQDSTIQVSTPFPPVSPITFPVGRSQYRLPAGNLTITNALNINLGAQVAVFVDGDVYIRNNITYSTDARNDPKDIPYFVIIARGNIYVDPNVSRLEGLYIAQPDDLTAANPTDGRIYTCAPGGAPPTVGPPALPGTNIYTACVGQLVVNGALVANQVKFMRAFNSLANSTVNERPTSFATGAGTNASEVINYSPEMYLAPSPIKDATTTNGDNGIYGKYDAVYNLPPVY